jgi:hypothetical protein
MKTMKDTKNQLGLFLFEFVLTHVSWLKSQITQLLNTELASYFLTLL